MHWLGMPALCALFAAPGVLAQEADWYPSRYGADDTLGAINNLSPEGVIEAAKLVKTGRTYSLAIETARDTPAPGTRHFDLYTVAIGDGTGSTQGTNRASVHDDFMTTSLAVGTQIDGLGHLGIEHRYYNGVPGPDFLRSDGVIRFGTHLLPPIVTRGVLLDVAAAKGVPQLPGGTPINRLELELAAARQQVSLRKGDVVLIHTGWGRVPQVSKELFLKTQPGLGKDGAEYLASLGVVAVGSDGWGLEVVPPEDPDEAWPVHQILLAKNGVYVLENIHTADLARDSAWEFLFVLGQPKFRGAVQMVINPVAIR